MLSWDEHEEGANLYLKASIEIMKDDVGNKNDNLKKAEIFASMANTHAQLAILRYQLSS